MWAGYGWSGDALQARGDVDQAIGHFKNANLLDPTKYKLDPQLGIAFAKARHFGEAIPLLRKLIEQEPKNAEAHVQLGLALDAMGKVDEAMTSYRRAIELDGKHRVAHAGLGNVLYRKHQFDDAIPILKKAVALDPQNAGAYVNLGGALSANAKGNIDEVIASFRKATEIDENHAVAQVSLGFALFHIGKIDESLPILRKGNELMAKNGQSDVWRPRTLKWLKADVAAWTKQLSPDTRAKTARAVELLCADPAFALIRDQSVLEKLPTDQRAAWQQFWNDARTLQQKSAAEKTP